MLWPAPHAPFLLAGTAQRHLIAMGLARGRAPDAVGAVLTTPLKKALRAVLATPPKGLARALSRLGERVWSAADYDLLLRLLTRPTAAKLLTHAEMLEPAAVRALDSVPEPLLRAGVHRLGLKPDQAALAIEAFNAIVARDGPRVGQVIAQRWARSANVEALMERLREDLQPELPPPPFPGGPRLRPLGSKAAMREAAARYNNCLRSQISSAAGGDSAFYEWSGPPGAIIEIDRDPLFGWRLSETRLKDNAVMAAADRPRLLADLAAMGVHVGRSGWDLQSATWSAVRPDFQLEPVEEMLRGRFGE